MSSIPEEMYHQILLRLPVKSLLRFKVCVQELRNKPNLILEGYYHWRRNLKNRLLCSIGYDSLTSSSIEDDAIDMDYPYKSLGYDVRFLGSCNGLVCIWLFERRGYDYQDYGDTGFICLWNPATREHKILPKWPSGVDRLIARLYAFRYDHKTGDYKLIIGVDGYGRSTDSTVFQVYSLLSDSWKSGQTVPYKFPTMLKYGVLVNGDLHWLAMAQDKFVVLALDISDESFKELQLPIEFSEKRPYPCMIMGALEGHLCAVVSSYVHGFETHVEVWEMLEYGVQESWTKRYVIDREYIISDRFAESGGAAYPLRLVTSFKNGEILFLNCTRLVLYDPKHRNARELKIHDNQFVYSENLFESLVSLNSGTYVVEKQ